MQTLTALVMVSTERQALELQACSVLLEDAVIYTVLSTSTELTRARVVGARTLLVYTRTEQRGGVVAPAAKHAQTHTHHV